MPKINKPHELDSQVARYFDLLIGMYFEDQNHNKLSPKGTTLGQFFVRFKEIYPQFVLDWMEDKDE
jgi:hypothetical protein